MRAYQVVHTLGVMAYDHDINKVRVRSDFIIRE